MLDVDILGEAGMPRMAPKRERNPISRSFSTNFARATYVGRPGSRRFQRHLNKSFLSAPEEIEAQDIVFFTSPMTPLSNIFEKGNQRKWEPFRAVTEEEQGILLKSFGIKMQPDDKTPSERVMRTARMRYDRIEKKNKQILRKIFQDDFFIDLEKDLLKRFLNEDIAERQQGPLEYSFELPFHRVACHSLCQYYNLHSVSKDKSDGTRVVQVQLKNSSLIPGQILSQYLLQELFKN